MNPIPTPTQMMELSIRTSIMLAEAQMVIGMRMPEGEGKLREIGRGSRQTLHVLGGDGNVRKVEVIVGDTNGTVTMITQVGDSGEAIRAGDRVITGELAEGG